MRAEYYLVVIMMCSGCVVAEGESSVHLEPEMVKLEPLTEDFLDFLGDSDIDDLVLESFAKGDMDNKIEVEPLQTKEAGYEMR